jgi:type II secretory pathway component PulF
MSYPEKQRSLWWVLLPIFFEIIGGIIAYFILRKDDQRLAKFCLNLSIVLTIVQLIAMMYLLSLIGESGLDSGLGINI